MHYIHYVALSRMQVKGFNGLILCFPPTSSPVSHVVVPDGTAPTTLSSLQGVLAGCWVIGYSCEYRRRQPKLPTTSPTHTCLLMAVKSCQIDQSIPQQIASPTLLILFHFLYVSLSQAFHFLCMPFIVKAKLRRQLLKKGTALLHIDFTFLF